MTKHRIRRALAAVAVLASTLVAGPMVTPAQAWVTPTVVGPYWNAASVEMEVLQSNGAGGDTGVYLTQSIGVSLSPGQGGANFADRLTGDQTQYYQDDGATLYVSWDFENPGNGFGCTAKGGNPTNINGQIRYLTGSGTAPWGGGDQFSAGIGGITGCSGETSLPIVGWDDMPTDGLDESDDPDFALIGNFEMYFYVNNSPFNHPMGEIGTRGEDAVGPGINAKAATGKFQIVLPPYQYLNGVNGSPGIDDVADNETGQGPGGTEKNFSLVREFEDVWGTMNTTKLNTWVNTEGKVMLWSTKPKNYGVAWTCTQTGSQVPLETCAGTSPWAASAADETTLDAQAVALQSYVNLARDGSGTYHDVPFIGWTVHHEPHDDAILDYSKGWISGKCGTSANAGADPSGSKKPCTGTAADYANLYAEMREAQQTACGGPCADVKIIYTAVGSNMYYSGVSGAADQDTRDVGEGDQLRPAAANYDMLGADTYNYSCFNRLPANFIDGVGNGTTTFTSATATFAAGDVNRKLEVRGVGVFTISSFTNATTVVLSGTVPSGTGKVFGVFRNPCDQAKWETFEQIVDDPSTVEGRVDEDGERYTVLGLARKLAAASTPKKVVLSEYATHPGCFGADDYDLNHGCFATATDDTPGGIDTGVFDRSDWFQQMYTWLTTDADPINHLLGFAYFHSEGTDLSSTDQEWRFLPVDDNGSDPAYLLHGTTGRTVWQNTIGSDANFVADSGDFTRPLS